MTAMLLFVYATVPTLVHTRQSALNQVLGTFDCLLLSAVNTRSFPRNVIEVLRATPVTPVRMT